MRGWVLRGVVICSAVFGLAACGVVPADGPATRRILDVGPDTPYRVVPVTSDVVRVLRGPRPQENRRLPVASSSALRSGDVLELRIWEATDDGLFATATSRETVLMADIQADGTLVFPHIGTVPASGRQVRAVREDIAQRLDGLAVDPQVQLRRVGGSGQTVTVSGDVRRPGRVEMDAGGLGVLEAIALSGGPAGPEHETEVALYRGTQAFRFHLSEETLRWGGGGDLQPGDRIVLNHRARSFAVFGALGDSRLFPFETESVTLAEAVARARGLHGADADPAAVFLFRYEDGGRLKQIGVEPLPVAEPDGYPTIYHLDLSEPSAFFLARSLRIEDKDIIYVADAPAAEFRQFIGTLVSPFFGGVESAQRATE